MRVFIYSLMSLLMLMPSMVCAMTCCDDTVKSESRTIEIPCHSEDVSFPGGPDSIMLTLDCMQVDLTTSSDSDLTSSVDLVKVLWIDTLQKAPLNNTVVVYSSIRAPPKDDVYQNIYLITRRIRV